MTTSTLAPACVSLLAEIDRLVGGDAPGDTQQDRLVSYHGLNISLNVEKTPYLTLSAGGAAPAKPDHVRMREGGGRGGTA